MHDATGQTLPSTTLHASSGNGDSKGAGGMRRGVPALPDRPQPGPSERTLTASREPAPADTSLTIAALPPRPAPGVAADDEAAAEKLRQLLKARLGKDVFDSWFGRLRLDEISDSQAQMSVPTTFLKSWINNNYIDLLTELWGEVRPGILKVELVVRSAHRGGTRVEASGETGEKAETTRVSNMPRVAQAGTMRPRPPHGTSPAGPVQHGKTIGSPLDARYTLETFVEGPANRIALAAARAIADGEPGAIKFNPLFIHASVGLGKTHLLQAIASRALAREGPSTPRVVYLTAEYFMWRFATAIRDNSALDFKEQLRDIDLLVIDDMQFLQGKSIQHEFCHLINMLLDSAKQVLVAADRPPADLESLDPRVRSRLQGGVALEIGGPDFAMRREILERRLAEAKREDVTLELAPEILDHVAGAITGSGRELEGAFNQILFRRSFEPDLTLARVDEMLGNIVRAAEPKRIRIEEIQRVVARHYNVSKQDLLSNRRTRTIVKPRQIAMYLAKTMTPRSLPEIGRRFGGRDHTTVLHAVRKIEGLTDEDQKLAQEVELLKRLINE